MKAADRIHHQRIFYLLILLFLIPTSSRADVSMSLFGLLDKANYSDTGLGANSSFSPGFGGAVEFDVFSPFRLELGAMYFQRKWNTDSSVSYLEVPVTLNYWITSFLSLGAGFYYARSFGSVTLSGVTETFSAAGFESDDGGITAALKVNVPVSSSFPDLDIEARYNYGLSNVSTLANFKSKFNDFQILLGFRFGSGGSGLGNH